MVRDVNDGIAHHLAVDAWFHAAPVFLDGERAARGALRRAPDAPKMGLFAHVAWELCLDGALVRRFGTEPLLDPVRASVAAVRPDAHHRAADLHVGLPTTDRARFDARVDSILDAIGLGPWVAGYGTAHGIVERLDGVRMRMGFAALPSPAREDVAAGLEALEGDADAALDAIVSSWSRSGS
ncbi:MAG: hypothetical protein ABSE49_31370 [Polyangiaceae bacterium]